MIITYATGTRTEVIVERDQVGNVDVFFELRDVLAKLGLGVAMCLVLLGLGGLLM